MSTDFDRGALLAARSATYVLHQDIADTYSRPIRSLSQRLVVVPKHLHYDQQRIADTIRVEHAEVGGSRRHTDRFHNSVIRVDIPVVHERVEFRVRAVLRRELGDCIDSVAWAPSTTPLTEPDEALRDTAATLRHASVRDTVTAMSSCIRNAFEYSHDVTSIRTTAAEAWQLRRGVCQDMAHVMLAMCAALDLPARYVSGHMVGDGASHAWVEVYDAAHREVLAIDPTHDRFTDLRYITTATGRDYRDVAPTSGTYASLGARGTLSVRKTIRIATLDGA
ncbi:MAG TPA: transglutaminase family protein [Ilumatobacteraceae bacterium]|nr:transglutaminase family protein [Ilumatobacteraceae bacterium]